MKVAKTPLGAAAGACVTNYVRAAGGFSVTSKRMLPVWLAAMALANVQVTRVAVTVDAEQVLGAPSMKAETPTTVSTVVGAGTFTVIVAAVSELLGTPVAMTLSRCA